MKALHSEPMTLCFQASWYSTAGNRGTFVTNLNFRESPCALGAKIDHNNSSQYQYPDIGRKGLREPLQTSISAADPRTQNSTRDVFR